jgi:hypothetical protein
VTARWRGVTVLACASLALLAAACSSSPAKVATSSTTTTTSSTPTTPAPPPTTSSTVASTSTTTTVATGCPDVSAAAAGFQGATGTITGTIVLSESGTASCTLNGYPTMALFTSSGAAIPVTMVDGLSVDVSTPANSPPSPVKLAAGSNLEFTYQYSDVPTGGETSCATSSTVSVTPPGNTSATRPFSLSMGPCNSGTIRVSPVYAAS